MRPALRRIAVITIATAISFATLPISAAFADDNPATDPAGADLVAPTGTPVSTELNSWPGLEVVQTMLVKDDVSPTAKITRTVGWGDGTFSSPAADEVMVMRHTYAKAGVYRPLIALTDQAGNRAILPLLGNGDDGRPQALTIAEPAFLVYLDRTTAATKGNLVTVSGDIADKAMANGAMVTWGDGSSDNIKHGVERTEYAAAHQYRTPGQYPISITIGHHSHPEATRVKQLGTVTIAEDTTKPVLTLAKPTKPTEAASYRTLTGTLTDDLSGVDGYAYAEAIQQRGKLWYSYTTNDAGAFVWAKAKNKADAIQQAAPLNLLPDANGTWTYALAALPTKGTLIITGQAADRAGNATTFSFSQVLTK